jgi:hypothetical protein
LSKTYDNCDVATIHLSELNLIWLAPHTFAVCRRDRGAWIETKLRQRIECWICAVTPEYLSQCNQQGLDGPPSLNSFTRCTTSRQSAITKEQKLPIRCAVKDGATGKTSYGCGVLEEELSLSYFTLRAAACIET